MRELIASFNNLCDFFTTILEEGRSLYDGSGIPARQAILVHSALSAFGYVPGGERTVVRALDSVRRKNGLTLAMPAHQDNRKEEREFDDPAIAEEAAGWTAADKATSRMGGEGTSTGSPTAHSGDIIDSGDKSHCLSGDAASRLRETATDTGSQADRDTGKRWYPGKNGPVRAAKESAKSGDRANTVRDESGNTENTGTQLQCGRTSRQNFPQD